MLERYEINVNSKDHQLTNRIQEAFKGFEKHMSCFYVCHH